tara:strand:+ start:1094 stop:2308 length:1215 start_codon:yes stop_codon:yes gene_type:complete
MKKIKTTELKIIISILSIFTKILMGEQLGLEKICSVEQKAVYITQPPSDSSRLFTVNEKGFIQIIKNGKTLKKPFLNISDKVKISFKSKEKKGLLGLAFDPNYIDNGFFYLSYINKEDSLTISRFRVTKNVEVADKYSEKTLIKVIKKNNSNFSGHLTFGPNDGFLYISLGDEKHSQSRIGNSLDLTNFYGKILRIDINDDFPYSIPGDNPYLGDIYKKAEIFCYGLQNPRRFSFDKSTNDLLISDISKVSWQEVNWISWGNSKNANFGWDIIEGNHCVDQEALCDTSGLVMPTYEYPSRVSYMQKLLNLGSKETYGCEVVGGYVYRGSKHRSLYGSYIFGDYCSNQIWVLSKKGGIITIKNIKSQLKKNSQSFPLTISSFGEDNSNELYVVDYMGAIYKLISN